MTEKTLANDLITAFPELKDEYKELIEWYNGDFPGNHNIVGDIFNPYILKLLSDNEDERMLKKAIDFINRMAESEDKAVVNVLQVTVLEQIGDYPEKLKLAKKFLSAIAIRLSDEVETFLGRQHNIE